MHYTLLLYCTFLFSAEMLFGMEDSTSDLTGKIEDTALHTIIENEDFYISLSKKIFNEQNPEEIIKELEYELNQLIDYRKSQSIPIPQINYLAEYYKLKNNIQTHADVATYLLDMTKNDSFVFLSEAKEDIRFLKKNILLAYNFACFQKTNIDNQTLNKIITDFAIRVNTHTISPEEHIYYKMYITTKINSMTRIQEIYDLLCCLDNQYLDTVYSPHDKENSIIHEPIWDHKFFNQSVSSFIQEKNNRHTKAFTKLKQIIPTLYFFDATQYQDSKNSQSFLNYHKGLQANIIHWMLLNKTDPNATQAIRTINMHLSEEQIRDIFKTLRTFKINQNLLQEFQSQFLLTEYTHAKRTKSKWPVDIMQENIKNIYHKLLESKDNQSYTIFLEESFPYVQDKIQYKKCNQLLQDQSRYINEINNLNATDFIDIFICKNNLFNNEIIEFCHHVRSQYDTQFATPIDPLIAVILTLHNIEKESNYAVYDKKKFFEFMLSQKTLSSENIISCDQINDDIHINCLEYLEYESGDGKDAINIPLQQCLFEYTKQQIVNTLDLKVNFSKKQQIMAKKAEIYLLFKKDEGYNRPSEENTLLIKTINELYDLTKDIIIDSFIIVDANTALTADKTIKNNISIKHCIGFTPLITILNTLNTHNRFLYPEIAIQIQDVITSEDSKLGENNTKYLNRIQEIDRVLRLPDDEMTKWLGNQPYESCCIINHVKKLACIDPIQKKELMRMGSYPNSKQNKEWFSHFISIINFKNQDTKIENVFDSLTDIATLLDLEEPFLSDNQKSKLINDIFTNAIISNNVFADVMKEFLQYGYDTKDQTIIKYCNDHPEQLAEYIYKHTITYYPENALCTILNIKQLIDILYTHYETGIVTDGHYNVTSLSNKLLAPLYKYLNAEHTEDIKNIIINMWNSHPEIAAQYIFNAPDVINNFNDVSFIKELINILDKNEIVIQKKYQNNNLSMILFNGKMRILLEKKDDSNDSVLNICNNNPLMLATYISQFGTTIKCNNINNYCIENITKLIDILNKNAESIKYKYNVTDLLMKLFTLVINDFLQHEDTPLNKEVMGFFKHHINLLTEYITKNNISYFGSNNSHYIFNIIKLIDFLNNNIQFIQKTYEPDDLVIKLFKKIIENLFDNIDEHTTKIIINYCENNLKILKEYLRSHDIAKIDNNNNNILIISELINILHNNHQKEILKSETSNLPDLSMQLFKPIIKTAFENNYNQNRDGKIITILNRYPKIAEQCILNNSNTLANVKNIYLIKHIVSILNKAINQNDHTNSLSIKLFEARMKILSEHNNENYNKIITISKENPTMLAQYLHNNYLDKIDDNNIKIIEELINILDNEKNYAIMKDKNYDVKHLSMKLFTKMIWMLNTTNKMHIQNIIIDYCIKRVDMLAKYLNNKDCFIMIAYNKIDITTILIKILYSNEKLIKNIDNNYDINALSMGLFKVLMEQHLNNENNTTDQKIISCWEQYPNLLIRYADEYRTTTCLNHSDNIKYIIKLIDILYKNEQNIVSINEQCNVTDLSIKLLDPILSKLIHYEYNIKKSIINLFKNHPKIREKYIINNKIKSDNPLMQAITQNNPQTNTTE
jgi:hypothetical protein